ncbi:hypothetical protein [Flagellimonas algicola]|uniref:Lipocalin-like protein n=1 Tax=Flagellimonas algicola TaxID=2583815 RepID=A0ABY2WHX2_9FLAO|nr:hypothetical protein [Allomuricauda algicola]TMU50990.1 hypothetical protein FGG15_17355 [Allomuricauda algicola]
MRLSSLIFALIICSCNPKTGNNNDKASETGKKARWDSKNIIGKWTQEVWVGVENKDLPTPPPAADPMYDTLWPPYYEIDKNLVKHFSLGIDSTKYNFDESGKVLILEGLRTDLIGYQKRWRILELSDSAMTIERKFSKHYPNAQNHFDGIDTIRLFEKF